MFHCDCSKMCKQIILLVLLLISQINTINIEPFIINGADARLGQFPWQVAIEVEQGLQKGFCGGALISDQWVLTAGHCIPRVKLISKLLCVALNALILRFNAPCFKADIKIYYGGIDLDTMKKNNLFVKSEVSIVHPGFIPLFLKNDIALVKLEKSIEFSSNVAPIELADQILPDNTNVVVAGYGKTSDRSNIATNLKFIGLNTITNKNCSKYYGSVVYEGVVCAVGKDKKSTCQGDSGGPLIIASPKPIHVGIVSFTSSKGCEADTPAGFTRTAYFRQWIKDISGV